MGELSEREPHEVYKCPRCGARSLHPMDVQERYCVACHRLPASTPARDDSADIDCSLFCLMAEQRISESGSGDETDV